MYPVQILLRVYPSGLNDALKLSFSCVRKMPRVPVSGDKIELTEDGRIETVEYVIFNTDGQISVILSPISTQNEITYKEYLKLECVDGWHEAGT